MRIQRIAFFSLLAIALWSPLHAQQRCGTTAIAADRESRFPEFQKSQADHDVAYQQYLGQARGGGGIDRVIPVVVHVIQQSSFNAISDARVQSQIDVLNEDFGLYNADTNLIPLEFKAVAANCHIRFCLASIDPNGCPTTGINRVVNPALANHNMNDEALLKGAIQWDPHRYLNMWVPVTIQDGVLGYATFPDWLAFDPGSDGVVINGTSFGRGFGTPAGTYNLGRTGTHEVGHWMGLYHTFQGGCAGTTPQNCASQGDRVCDTPPTANSNFGCPGVINTCTETFVDHNDQTMNYMDYTDDRCMQMFSIGQNDRIDFYFNSDRDMIWSAPNLTVTGCDGTVSPGCQPVCAFDASMESVCTGQSIQFHDLSTGPATSWAWTFPSGNPGSATVPDPIVSWSVPGTYTVTLVVSNVAGSDTLTTTITVSVASTGPIAESFEVTSGFPAGWSEYSQSDTWFWTPIGNAASNGTRSVAAHNFLQEQPGLQQDLLSPPYALPGSGSSILTFDHAYKRRTGFSNDSLQVWASIDCGDNWQKIWERGGFGLSTTGGFQAASAFVPTATQWRSDTADLSAFLGAADFRLKFRVVGGNSQDLYLDNINLQTLVGALPRVNLSSQLTVYPNPTSAVPTVQFQSVKSGMVTLRMMDLQGRVLYQGLPEKVVAGNRAISFPSKDWGMLPAGLYLMQVVSGEGVATVKVVKTN